MSRNVCMALGNANTECSGTQQVKGRCVPCGSTVLFHCLKCGIQVTGCVCTARERLGEDKAIEMFGEERVRGSRRANQALKDAENRALEQASKSGLIIPGFRKE